MRNKYSIELIADIKSKVNLFKSNKDLSEAVGLPEKALSDLMYRNRIFREGNNTFLERKKSLFLLALSKLSDKQRYNYLKRIETLQTTVVFWQDI